MIVVVLSLSVAAHIKLNRIILLMVFLIQELLGSIALRTVLAYINKNHGLIKILILKKLQEY
jgi:hypothetical protein